MRLRHFYKIDHKKQPIPGSNIKRKSKPSNQWIEIIKPCCTEQDIPCTCGPRFFVQLDSTKSPVPGTLIKRNVWPKMESGINYAEVEWKSRCCYPGEYPIIGGAGADPCIADTATFYMSTETIGIGTYLYESDQSTAVTASYFRDNATGIIYEVINGLVTGISLNNCIQALVVENNSDVTDDLVITGVTVNDVAIIFGTGDNFSILQGEAGNFTNAGFAPGLRTIKVTMTGTDVVPSDITVTDSALAAQTQAYTGAGVYTFTNVLVAGPNMDAAAVTITVDVI